MDVRNLSRMLKIMPTLETERLRLEKITIENAEDMYEYASDPKVTRYLLWNPHLNLFETKGFIEHVKRKYRSGEFFDWGINLKSNNKFIGTVGFTTVDPDNDRAELGYVLAPSYWRRGLMFEALSRVIDFAFDDCGFGRLELKIMPDNISSRSIAEKLGFSYEGTLREYMIIKEKPEDVCFYSLLKRERSNYRPFM